MKTQAEIGPTRAARAGAAAVPARDWNGVRFDPASRRGHVESYFLKLNDPSGRRALWLKTTILARGDTPPVAEAWAIAFDREGEHTGAKEVVPFDRASFSADRLDVRVADLRVARGRVEGAVEGRKKITCALSFTPEGAPLVPFPSLRMYEGPLPSSKLVTPHPDVRFSGFYTVGGERVDVDGWRGMQGHNWGRRHAELYAWAHCNQWDDADELVLEGVTARVKVGPLLAPPLTVVCVRYRGVRYELNQPSVLLRSRGVIGARAWSFHAESRLARVEGELSAETKDFVGLHYENPNGEMTYCLNSKIASGTLRLQVKGRPLVTAKTSAAALEIGTKDPSHGVRMLL